MPFEDAFEKLTGNSPLSWQTRLHNEWFAQNKIPQIIDLPTGLGKTMVMAIWLLAIDKQLKEKKVILPRRLVYVVDRRTVVDQSTDLAERLIKNAKAANIDPPAISTLRGQLADNPDWTRDLSRPAIIIGTVDMIGSRLLFSGYRSSYKKRPLDAGLLGQDSLLLLDEAHLSKPFEKLICEIERLNAKPSALPFKVCRMSATTARSDVHTFKLEPSDLNGDSETNPVVKRYNARKQLSIEPPIDKTKINKALAQAATELAKDNSRIVVFVRSPDDAASIANSIRASSRPKKTHENPDPKGPFADAVEVLTGTMRGLERDKLLQTPVMTRFATPDNGQQDSPAILISTSAGEVGFDLNADHMVCDAAPFDSMIQRFGRVNRRGTGNAVIRMFLTKDPKDTSEFERATIEATKLLKTQSGVSPKAIAEFKFQLTAEELAAASTPVPAMLELTDILLDNWSMTSIAKPMPGRPEVAPWLRGISEDLPQTTIAWRAELGIEGFDQLDIADIEEWFDNHPILTHETLTVPADNAAKWLLERWQTFDMSTDKIANGLCIIDHAGLQKMPLRQLLAELQRKNTDSLRNADLILPADFGGISRGILDEIAPFSRRSQIDAPPDEEQASDTTPNSADVADEQNHIAPGSPGITSIHRRRAICINGVLLEKDILGFKLDIDKTQFAEFPLSLSSKNDETTLQLVSYIPKTAKLEWGSEKQSLTKHVTQVKQCANEIAQKLQLPDLERNALTLAAHFHDHGKNRERWQHSARRAKDEEVLGKSGGKMLRDSRGYRHEFGSLRELIDAHKTNKAQGSYPWDPSRRTEMLPHPTDEETFDLAMHLIAAHHGRGRPHFPKGAFDPDTESRSYDIHMDALRRFVRLQRKHGHWRIAWLENLLRCADSTASGQQNGEK